MLHFQYRDKPQRKCRWIARHQGVPTNLYLSPEVFSTIIPRYINAVVKDVSSPFEDTVRLSVPLSYDRPHTETIRYRADHPEFRDLVGHVYLPTDLAQSPPAARLRLDLTW